MHVCIFSVHKHCGRLFTNVVVDIGMSFVVVVLFVCFCCCCFLFVCCCWLLLFFFLGGGKFLTYDVNQ